MITGHVTAGVVGVVGGPFVYANVVVVVVGAGLDMVEAARCVGSAGWHACVWLDTLRYLPLLNG